MDPSVCAPQAAELDAEIVSLYQQHAAGLLRYGASLAPNGDEVRDAVQEVYLRYFIERRYGRAIEHPRAWLYQVLRNHLLDRLKSAALNRQVPAEELEHVPDGNLNPEKVFQRNELAGEIAAALTGRELECLCLRVQGLGYTEIASVLGIRSGTVGALLARVHNKLRPPGRDWSMTGIADAICAVFLEGQSHAPLS